MFQWFWEKIKLVLFLHVTETDVRSINVYWLVVIMNFLMGECFLFKCVPIQTFSEFLSQNYFTIISVSNWQMLKSCSPTPNYLYKTLEEASQTKDTITLTINNELLLETVQIPNWISIIKKIPEDDCDCHVNKIHKRQFFNADKYLGKMKIGFCKPYNSIFQQKSFIP